MKKELPPSFESQTLPRRQFLKWTGFLAAPFISSWNFLQFLFPSSAKAGGFLPFAFVKKPMALQKDSQIKNTVMLLNVDGANAAQNNTLIDSSANNLTITRLGNVNQGSLSPFGTSWSHYFTTTSALSTTGFTNLSNSNFTIEFWINFNSFGSDRKYLVNANDVSSYWQFIHDSSFGASLRISGYASVVTQGSNSGWSIGTWYHVALVRNGSTFTIYRDGSTLATGSYSGSIGNFTNTYIAGYATGGGIDGYLSNLRVATTAIYTNSSFTPPTAPLTAVANTVLLTCNSYNYFDQSSNNFALTVIGNPQIHKFSPFPVTYNSSTFGGSAFFDGAGDYCSIANNAATNNLGTGDFTIELWYKSTITANNTHAAFVASYSSPVVGSWSFKATSSNSGYIQFASYGPSWNDYVTTTNVAADMAWHHCAVTRSSGTLRIFVDGIVKGTWTSINTDLTGGGHPLTIGFKAQDSTSYLTGFLANIRLVKGTALYTSNFTPPTNLLTAVSNTQLLCNFTNGGIYDSMGFSDFETVGSVQINTSTKKYGTGAINLTSNADDSYLKSSPNICCDFSTGDFTIEFWMNPLSVSTTSYCDGNATLFDLNQSAGAGVEWFAIHQVAAGIAFGSNSAVVAQATSGLTASTWSHVAVVRYASTVVIYIDGTSKTSATYSATIGSSTRSLYIGKQAGYSNRFFKGYLDDLRITKGVARYTANFIPPAQAMSAN